MAKRLCFLLGSTSIIRVNILQFLNCQPNQQFSLNKSGLEENCIRSRNQIRILGIAKGWDLLPSNIQDMTTNTEGMNNCLLSDLEKKVLDRMRREVGESELTSCVYPEHL